jgi:hypothetical protein
MNYDVNMMCTIVIINVLLSICFLYFGIGIRYVVVRLIHSAPCWSVTY